MKIIWMIETVLAFVTFVAFDVIAINKEVFANEWQGGANHTSSQTWSSTSLSLVKGSGYKIGDNDRTIATFDHSSGGKLGSNYFFFDVINPNSNFITIYGEWRSAISLTGLLNWMPHFELIKSISIVGEYDYGTNPITSFSSYYIGVGVDLNIKSARYITLSVMHGGARSIDGDTEQITLAWSFPFSFSAVKGEFNGYIDHIGSESRFVSNIQAQPQLLFDVGHIVKYTNRLFLGIEYQYWRNKFGIRNVDEKVAQLIMTLKF